MSSMDGTLHSGSSSRWDRLGIWASAACAVHCLIAPALFLLAPALAEVWANPASHAIIALVVLPVAATVLRRGFRLHRKAWIAVTTTVGILLILIGCVLPYLAETAVAAAGACTECCPHLLEGSDGELQLTLPPASIVTVLGSLFLVASHVGNLVYTRSCCSPVVLTRPS